MTCEIEVECILASLPDFAPLYRMHHAEMRARLKAAGLRIAPIEPDLARYEGSANAGSVVHLSVRKEGEAVGYANFFLCPSLHTGEIEAIEDAVYILPEHRGRLGRRLVRAMMDEARKRGAVRLQVGTTTDPRAAQFYERMGFTPVSTILAVDIGD